MGGDGQIFRIRDKGGHRRSHKTLNIGGLVACVNTSSSAAARTRSPTFCGSVHGTVRVPNFIELVSMDIEGREADVLSTWPWESVEVGVFIIENKQDVRSRDQGKLARVREIMAEQGYLQTETENRGVDEYFVQPRFWAPKLAQKDTREHPPGSKGC
jgi:hypothetical protein